jgi:aldehyde:ferredoxin oxidoreductase
LFGYHGRYLRIDLSTGQADAVPLPEGVRRRFVGGSGLGTWILLRESRERQEPLAAEAPLAFVFSPLVGSPLTTSAKFAVVAQSPLTLRINDSLASSAFAIAGKRTGYDALVIVGRAERLSCLLVEPGGIRLEDATDLAGRSIPATEAALKTRLGAGWRTAVIGPAGENGVRYATVSHDGRHAGRGGLGAVMGSKRLKAVAVRGDRTVEWAHPDELVALSRDLSRKSFGPATAKYRELGTVSNLLTFNRLGTLPTRNFQAGHFAEAVALAPETINATHHKARGSCAACTIGCEHIYRLPGTDADGKERGVRMEYENLFALGPLCGVSDPDIVLRASALCDEWGLDTISTGATVAFGMECAERGLIDAPELRFGNGAELLRTIERIGRREGIGEVLSLGTRAAATEIGQGAADFAPHVKGLEIPGYEPRALQTMALGFAIGTRGADHNRSGAYQVDFSADVDRLDVGTEAVLPAIRTEDEAAAMDSLILCKFLRGTLADRFGEMAEMLHLVTGWDMNGNELRAAAARVVAAKKWFNIRQGWTPAEDTLPKRFLSEPLSGGASEGAALSEPKLRSLVRAYNLARGWTEAGWLPDAVTAELRRGL